MKNTKLARAIAAALASVSVLSTFASISVSAENAAAKIQKKIYVGMADGAFTTIETAFPGGRIIMAPFKVLFHSAVDNPDPSVLINQKLDQITDQMDQISNELFRLEKKADDNTKMLTVKIDATQDKSNVQRYFEKLCPAATLLSRDIAANESNTDLSPQQKIMRIAQLSQKENYRDVQISTLQLTGAMEGTGNIYTSFYDTIYTNMAVDKRMFSREAYRDAKKVADDLCAQYLAAACLMQEVQVACEAVGNFDEDDLKELGTLERRYYDEFDAYRASYDYADATNAIVACADGFEKFQKNYDNSDFINKGITRVHFDMNCVTYAVGEGSTESKTEWGEMGDFIRSKNRPLTQQNLKDLVDYVRQTYPGTSFIEFLRDMGVTEYCKWTKSAYLVLDDSEAESIDLLGYEYPLGNRIETRKHSFGFAKVIDVTDPNLTVRALTYKTCKQKKMSCWFFGWSERSNRYLDFEPVTQRYLVIY